MLLPLLARLPQPLALIEVGASAGLCLFPDAYSYRYDDGPVLDPPGGRSARLTAAVEIARRNPPTIVRGDVNSELAALIASVPRGATPVVFHTAVLAYLDLLARERFVETVKKLPGHWISNEGVSVTPGVEGLLAFPHENTAEFLVALDGHPAAYAQPHGRHLEWIA